MKELSWEGETSYASSAIDLGDVSWHVAVDESLHVTVSDSDGVPILPVFASRLLVKALIALVKETPRQVTVIPERLHVSICMKDGVPQPLYWITDGASGRTRHFVVRHQATSALLAQSISMEMDMDTWSGKVFKDPFLYENAVWFNPSGTEWSTRHPRYVVSIVEGRPYEKWCASYETLRRLYEVARTGPGNVATWCPHFPRVFKPYPIDRLSAYGAPMMQTQTNFQTFGEKKLAPMDSGGRIGARWMCVMSVLTQAMYTALALEHLGVPYLTDGRCWGIVPTKATWVTYVISKVKVTIPTCGLQVVLINIPPCDFNVSRADRQATMSVFNPLNVFSKYMLNCDFEPKTLHDVLTSRYISAGLEMLKNTFEGPNEDFARQCASDPSLRQTFYLPVWVGVQHAWRTYRKVFFGTEDDAAPEAVDAKYVMPFDDDIEGDIELLRELGVDLDIEKDAKK